MRCPHCGTMEDKVIDSRTLANGAAIRRRRECVSCGYRFTSYEKIDEKQFMVVKRDGKREPFDRSKLERGIGRALEKRPFSRMQIENLVNEIEDETAILSKGAGEIPSAVIGEKVLEMLEGMDKVAYIRFASVYRQFGNLEEFVREINKLGSAT
ncbi:MAG: transcriptional regulator NrdR [Spirochaetes bacterium]|nr:transcriptional regulator NrdR [Spirochaetota bacterium]